MTARHFTPEQRQSWIETTRDSPFNLWLKHRVSDRSGRLDLRALHQVAAEFGVEASQYAHLNPGQQRMNIGNRLRRLVPESVYVTSGTTVAYSPASPLLEAILPDHLASPPPSSALSDRDLMRRYAAVVDELRDRGIVRTGNAPLGDYAEFLFAKAFAWTLAGNSAAGHDATDAAGLKFQIKARRLRSDVPGERQLSIIRALPEARFDYLAAVLFDKDFGVFRAALVPHSVVAERASYVAHVNGWRLILDDAIWSETGVRDVSRALREQAEQ